MTFGSTRKDGRKEDGRRNKKEKGKMEIRRRSRK